ncbi:MAG: hypothetical protein QOE45_3016 [Frankiaceae bacterium]|nr:hypothetical protein [Frankiaceae bacterium]
MDARVTASLDVPDGPPLAVSPVSASAAGGTVRLTVDVDEAGWERVRDEALFHLDPDHAGRGFTGASPGAAYRLVLRLDGPPPPSADPDDLLRERPSTADWFAEDVQRELPLPEDAAPGARIAEGYRTGWAPAPAGDAPLLDACRAWFAARDMQASRVEGATVLRLAGDGTNGSWTLWLETRETDRVVIVWSAWPDTVPEERRRAVMELVTRLNPDIAVGAYELDLDRGQVSVRTSVELGDAPLHDDLIAGLVGANVEVFDTHLPALLAVVDGVDPVSALTG